MDYLTYNLPSGVEFRVGFDARSSSISFHINTGIEWEGYKVPVIDALAVGHHLTRASKAALIAGSEHGQYEYDSKR